MIAAPLIDTHMGQEDEEGEARDTCRGTRRWGCRRRRRHQEIQECAELLLFPMSLQFEGDFHVGGGRRFGMSRFELLVRAFLASSVAQLLGSLGNPKRG